MDENAQTPVSNPQPLPVNPMPQPQAQPQFVPVPQTPTKPPSEGGKKWLKILLILLVLAVLIAGGIFAYNYYLSTQTFNAGVYKEPQTTNVKVSPTPSDILNPNDTSDGSIDSNNQTVDKSLSDLDSDLNNVNDSLNDKQTNLQ